jgi:hypothetical protein
VPEELATEGVVLSRRNLALQIEQLGDKWLVSLVNLTTGRVSASTKLDALPADREAAVAAMTHIVADLAEQVVGRAEPPPPPPSPSPPPPAAVGDEDRPERSAGELDYKRQSIHFGERYLIMGSPSSVTMERTWVAFKGELDLELQPLAFYAAVGRPDLGAKYTARRDIMFGS